MAAPSRRTPVTFNTPKVSDDTAPLPNTFNFTFLQKGQFYQVVRFYKKPWNEGKLTGDPRGYVIKLTSLGLRANPYCLLQNIVTSSSVVIMRNPKFSETSFRRSQTV